LVPLYYFTYVDDARLNTNQGFYSFPENTNFVFSKRSVNVRDNKTKHCLENDNTILTALLDNSFIVFFFYLFQFPTFLSLTAPGKT